MQVFEIKTNRSDYPYLVVAEGFKKAVEILYNKGIYDSNIVYVRQLENYNSSHILIEEALIAKERLKAEVRKELSQILPQWKQMPNGAAGGDDEKYLIRSSKGHYFMSSCIGGSDYYLELESLEYLPGLSIEYGL